ncbi:MAG TPA: 30S ribosomal protein S17 [Anaerolineae bacterium]|nr:30S ribosomal protein S17 [Anaerolineae bacterium]
MNERRKRLVGRVTSDKMDKTVVVTVERLQRHPLYGKVIRRASKFKAHNAGNTARAGDLVRIVESRPISRDKRWIVEEIVEKARG